MLTLSSHTALAALLMRAVSAAQPQAITTCGDKLRKAGADPGAIRGKGRRCGWR
ncbi:MAG: hypothetical protein ACREO9_07025 [Lysobacterales bacterium]